MRAREDRILIEVRDAGLGTDPAQFVRVHRLAAVNVRHVRELLILGNGSLTARLTSGAEIGVAKPCRAEMEDRLRALP